MSIRTATHSAIARAAILIAALLVVVTACSALPTLLLQGVESEVAPQPTTKTLCESSDDLALAIEELRDADLSEDGLAEILVLADAALSEARLLAELVGEELRPTVSDLVLSLQGLRTSIETFGGQDTVGAGIAAIGESITEIGQAMDTLGTQLRTRCP